MAGRVALVFPPLWYYPSVPADLLLTGSHLRARGVDVRCFDLNAGFTAHALATDPGYLALRRHDTYLDDAAYADASASVRGAWAAIGQRHRVDVDFYKLRLGDVDETHVPSALALGMLPARNPAFLYLRDQAVPAILDEDPAVVAIALVHPDQILQVIVLARLLREAGFRGVVVLYGAHEDVIAPEDFVDDLVGEPRHAIFELVDAVVIGEAETALEALARGEPRDQLPGMVAPAWGLSTPVRGRAEDVSRLAPIDPSLVDPAIYPFPEPVFDLRLSRSCPWGRCTFCAITVHQAGYRARTTSALLEEMTAAHRAFGSTYFRLRDDLITPDQLRELAVEIPKLGFAPRWSIRARFEPGFDRATLRAAAAAGLEEMWLGLESASVRVRSLMVKGVAQRVVERILGDAGEAEIRVRALCMIGYPGETIDEARETIDFLDRWKGSISHIALTPFQLMRNTPLGRDPEAFGLRRVGPAGRSHDRLRYQLDVEGDTLLSRHDIGALLREAAARLSWTSPAVAGPTLTHAWMRWSAARNRKVVG